MAESPSIRRCVSGTFRIAVLLALSVVTAGCGGRQTIEGTVTLDSRPLEQGYINFRPMAGAKGPPVGAPIQQGKYAVRTQEPLEGDFRVEITSLGKTGRKTRAESGALVDMEGQVLPARYNTKSTLQAHVKPGQRNEFPFEVTSK